METQQMPLKRTGTPGLDVFKIAGRSISGFVHSFKTGDPRRVRLPFTTHLEERLAMYLEYSPHVRSYQRGDASEACVKTYDLVVPLGTPYRINYIFDSKAHEYLPDYVGTYVMVGCSLQKQGVKKKKALVEHLSKPKQHDGWHRLRGASTGLAQILISMPVATRTGCICTHVVSLSPPFKKL